MPSAPWVRLITAIVIILSSLVVVLYLAMVGRITPILPVLVGNATVSPGGVKVTLMAFGGTFKITGMAILSRSGTACINNASWVLQNGQSAVFTFNCPNASNVIVTHNNGEILIINIPR